MEEQGASLVERHGVVIPDLLPPGGRHAAFFRGFFAGGSSAGSAFFDPGPS